MRKYLGIVQRNWWELVCFCTFAALVGYQIFIPPVTGLANNSDFAYILMKLSICPADREKQDNIYLVTDYFVDPVSCTYDYGLISTEVPLVMAATYLSQPFTGEKKLDLRALSAIHLAILMAAFGILLSLTSRAGPALRYGVPALFILIFSDVAYTCYLNSVYLDAPAYVLLLALAAAAAAASLNHLSKRAMAAYVIFGVALVFTKSQHAVLGILFAVLALILALRPARRLFRIAWISIALILTGSTLFMLSQTPSHYKLFALYNVIFSRLTPHSQTPWQVLHELGLGDDELKLVTSHAYRPEAPVYDDKWAANFLERTSFSKLVLYYLNNPEAAFNEMNRDLHSAAPILRPKDMANFREKDGYPPRAMATRFSLWSNLRSQLLQSLPYHVLPIYLAPFLVWLAGWKWRSLWSPLLPLAMIVSTAGVMEFAMSSLTDALDNSRHLFMFQIITEMMILLIAAALLDRVDHRKAATRRAGTAVRIELVRRLKTVPVWETSCMALFTVLAGYQLFIPPVTGLANNSDFIRVLGPWSICSDHQTQNNRSLVTHYDVKPDCEYDSGIVTLEKPLVGIALWLSGVFLGDAVFDLRFLAALHLLILLIGFEVLLHLTHRGPPAILYGVPILFMLIFSDVAYTAHLNSAYLDAPALVLLITASAIAAAACFNHQTWTVSIAYLVAGAAMIFSKSQHAALGLWFAILALYFAWRSIGLLRRVRWIMVAALLTGSTVTMVVLTPDNYSLYALYSLIFSRLAPHSSEPIEMLQEVGLDHADMQYVHTNAYTPGAPIYTALWAEDFLRRTSFSDVILYYLRHPSVPLSEMNDELRTSAPVIRPRDMPNFREEDGIPPGTMDRRFSLWSSARSFALRIFPYHVILFYLAPWAAVFLAWKYRQERMRWPLIPLALILTGAGALEFAMATLTDALDVARHLFLFHAVTDLLILLIAAALLDLWTSRKDARGKV